MPDELWTEVRDIVEETGVKAIPMEKKCFFSIRLSLLVEQLDSFELYI